MSGKKRKHDPDVQGTLWPVDEFDKPDVDHMTPIEEGVFNDTKEFTDCCIIFCEHQGKSECPNNCLKCEYFE